MEEHLEFSSRSRRIFLGLASPGPGVQGSGLAAFGLHAAPERAPASESSLLLNPVREREGGRKEERERGGRNCKSNIIHYKYVALLVLCTST